FSPDGKPLCQNAGEGHQAGQDLTFSAPKSASALWAVSDDEVRKLIEEAQREAVMEALRWLEETAGWARVGKGGLGRARAKLNFALFEHGTTRDGGFQLHTHALDMNLGVCEDGRTRTRDWLPTYRAKMAAGAFYRVALAEKLASRLGVEIERKASWFEVKGV